jgi:hypothetical protein
MFPLTNSRDAIKALGGDARVMAWLDLEPGRLSMIKSRGYIPRGLHLHFYLTLQDRGLSGTASLYGLTAEQYARLIMPRPAGKSPKVDTANVGRRIMATA